MKKSIAIGLVATLFILTGCDKEANSGSDLIANLANNASDALKKANEELDKDNNLTKGAFDVNGDVYSSGSKVLLFTNTSATVMPSLFNENTYSNAYLGTSLYDEDFYDPNRVIEYHFTSQGHLIEANATVFELKNASMNSLSTISIEWRGIVLTSDKNNQEVACDGKGSLSVGDLFQVSAPAFGNASYNIEVALYKQILDKNGSYVLDKDDYTGSSYNPYFDTTRVGERYDAALVKVEGDLVSCKGFFTFDRESNVDFNGSTVLLNINETATEEANTTIVAEDSNSTVTEITEDSNLTEEER